MIDILMAVYNGEKFISQQLDSILKQSYGEWHLLIHDDGSTDNTVDIVNKYAQMYPERITVIDDGIKCGGAKKNFFHLMKYSEAPYVMFADQDDVWKKDKVKHAYESIKQAEGSYPPETPLLLHGDLQVVNKDLELISSNMSKMQKLDMKKSAFKDYLVQNNVTGCTVIYNRVLGKMCTDMPDEAIMHDWWLALIAACFGAVIYMDYSDILYRQHGNNTEGAKNLKNPFYLIKKLFSGKDVKGTLELTYKQAEAFENIFGEELNKEGKELIAAYLSLKKLKKLKKYRVVKKYGFMKTGFARKLGYILFV